MIKECKNDTLFPILTSALGSANWHVREEVLLIFITAMLTIDHNIQFDFLTLIQPIAKLLDDEKTKIRFVASETLAVIAHVCGIDEVNRVLHPMLAESAFRTLQPRFLRRVLPVLKADYVEFPKQHN
jgi:hypothetical protein